MKPKISEVIITTHVYPRKPFSSTEQHPNVDVEFWRAQGKLRTFESISPTQFRRISRALYYVPLDATRAQADGENVIVYFDTSKIVIK